MAAQSQLCDLEIAGLMFEFVQARESELNIAITMAEMGKVPMFRGIWLQSLRDLSGQPGYEDSAPPSSPGNSRS